MLSCDGAARAACMRSATASASPSAPLAHEERGAVAARNSRSRASGASAAVQSCRRKGTYASSGDAGGPTSAMCAHIVSVASALRPTLPRLRSDG